MGENDTQTTESATMLGRLGAAKGGKARASVLTPEERSEMARNAVVARWKKKKGSAYEPPTEPAQEPPKATNEAKQVVPASLPYSMFQGPLHIGNVTLECHVLNDLRRVFTQREVVKALSGGRTSGDLKVYLDRNPLIDAGLVAAATIKFSIPGNPTAAIGYEATLLIDICEKYLQARETPGALKPSQYKLATQAGIIIRACAKVGIIALIDEATGFQEVRQKRALQLKLQAFIADDMQEWARMFPEEFWLELARLEGIRYSPRSRPLRWGKYVMAFVYDAIDKDIGKKLREINPNPHFRMNHHQWLKEFGRDKVNNQIHRVIGTMQACDTMEDFKQKFARIFKKMPTQLDFGFDTNTASFE